VPGPAGVDWGHVEKYVDVTGCYQHYKDPSARPPRSQHWFLPWTWCLHTKACAAAPISRTAPPQLSPHVFVTKGSGYSLLTMHAH
jgi:hypothetical protein